LKQSYLQKRFALTIEFILKKRMQQGNEFLQKPKSTNLILPSTFPVTALIRRQVSF
jgi:hypothetical protein